MLTLKKNKLVALTHDEMDNNFLYCALLPAFYGECEFTSNSYLFINKLLQNFDFNPLESGTHSLSVEGGELLILDLPINCDSVTFSSGFVYDELFAFDGDIYFISVPFIEYSDTDLIVQFDNVTIDNRRLFVKVSENSLLEFGVNIHLQTLEN
ncbi:MAG TPA: hypothetical protein VLZ29_03445 [Sulfurimonas sp.]|uniref:hypothetical protein n=1 Tax=Sulfurimonas sp. TaxID=2022749 RepID=UPI002CEEAC32|nr:hypothetical protein [Sulfurimonas sp.]HUH42147.1 hypothetical protein [Sulfurimonas sp.]